MSVDVGDCLHLMFHYREKNLEVSKKEAKAKEKKNEEKQAQSKDDADIDHEERLQEVCLKIMSHSARH